MRAHGLGEAIQLTALRPVLSSSDAVSIVQELERCLMPAKVEKLKIPWSQKRHLSKEERKRNELLLLKDLPLEKQHDYEKAGELRKWLMLGVNSVTRGIENGDAACCILEEEVAPDILVKHIATLAHHSKVPVLVVPGLKTATKNSLGFSCLALAFKKSVLLEKSNIFFEMCQSISQKAEEFSTEYTCLSPCLFEDADSIMKSLGTFISRKKFTVKEVNMSKIHLLRESNDDRMFKPKSLLLPIQGKNNITEEQFIPLSSSGNSFVPVKLKKGITSLRPNKKALIKDKPFQTLGTDNEMEVDCSFSLDTNPSASDIKFPHNSDRENVLCRSYKHAKVLRVQSNPDKIRKTKDKCKFKKMK